MPNKKSNKEVSVVTTINDDQKEIEIKQQSVEVLLGQAVEKGLSVETIEKIMAMRKEINAEFAKRAFDAAMCRFQARCPVIEKTKAGARTKETKEIAYFFAPFNEIINKVQPLLEETGLSYTFDAIKENGRIKVTCWARHKLGHERPTTIDVPQGTGTPIMSAPQIEMATMSYAKRYAFCNAFGVVTGDEDIDGQELDQQPAPKANKVGTQNAQTPTNAVTTETKVVCAGSCGQVIEDEAVIAYSRARYGKPLCRTCQTQQS